MAVVTPLNNFLGPEGDTVTMDEQLLNTEYCLAAVLLCAALPAGMGFQMLLRRSGTPCCSIGLARGPGSTWVLAETRAGRHQRQAGADAGGTPHP